MLYSFKLIEHNIIYNNEKQLGDLLTLVNKTHINCLSFFRYETKKSDTFLLLMSSDPYIEYFYRIRRVRNFLSLLTV